MSLLTFSNYTKGITTNLIITFWASVQVRVKTKKQKNKMAQQKRLRLIEEREEEWVKEQEAMWRSNKSKILI